MREISLLFNMTQSSFERILERCFNYFERIAPSIIKFPTSNEEEMLVREEFERVAGFKNVIGCIDGSYIPIRKPAHKCRSTYINRHDQISLTLQAICDSKLRFLDIFTGVSSKIHDSRVLSLSYINETLPTIVGQDRHILGDSAYPICTWLLTPYKDYGNLTPSHVDYNYRFSKTRVKIENAFGLLKSRFRQLIRLDFWKVKTMSRFILSCCVLHNLCIDNNDTIEFEPENQFHGENLDNNLIQASTNILKRRGEEKRDIIRQQMNLY